jgi:hypothetical protein
MRDQIGSRLMHQIQCPCGVMTRLCETRDILLVVWNSTGRKRLKAHKIEIKYPGPRGAEPGTEAEKQIGEPF